MKLPAPVNADGLRKQTQMKFGGYEALGTEGGLCNTENLTTDYIICVPTLKSTAHRSATNYMRSSSYTYVGVLRKG